MPSWTDKALNRLKIVVPLLAGYVIIVGMLAASPETTNVGYTPQQPVPFSHKLHAGELRMDCRYCHNTVEKAAHAAVPPTQTCINCHAPSSSDGAVRYTAVHANSEKLAPIHESYASGLPVEWERVHDLPDYVYFDHASHISAGVGCVSCHGRIDQMEVVGQVETMSMKWCLECHRNPGPHIRSLDRITAMDLVPEYDLSSITETLDTHQEIEANQNCSTCHR